MSINKKVDHPDIGSVLARRRIEAAVNEAGRTGHVIDLATARLIAASVHRGLATELERFAATGVVPNGNDYQVMRLELDMTCNDEPQMAEWADALKDFFTDHMATRRGRPATTNRKAPRTEGGRPHQRKAQP